MALTPPAPTTITPQSRWILHWLKDTYVDPLIDTYDWISGTAAEDDLEWRKVVATFSRTTPVGTVEDLATIGFHIVNITNGDLDKSWTTGDYQQVTTDMTPFFIQWASIAHQSHTAVELRFYIMRFNPDLPVGVPVTTLDPATQKPYERFAPSGTVAHVSPLGLVGTVAGGSGTYQSAMSLTWRTAQRKHWGRVYLPGLWAGELSANGRFNTATITPMINAAAKMGRDLNGHGFHHVVPSTQSGGNFHVGHQSITQYVVDDIPDVVRRRRPKQPLAHIVGV